MFYNVDFDEIKLDMNLLPINETEVYKENIYSTVIDSLRLKENKLVSEGIEDEYQFNLAIKNGIDYLQAYYLYRPLSLEKFTEAILKK